MASQYTLYGDIGTGSATVELTLAELGIEYQFSLVPLDTDAQLGTEFEALNPQKKLPALACPDNSIITESVAIILWLLERHGDRPLLPETGSHKRAQALRWLLFMASDLYQLIEIYDFPERFCADGDPELLRDNITGHWKRRWQLIEENISGPWLLGDTFSITDIYIAVVSRWANLDSWRSENLPRVENIAQGVSNRPLCKSVWSRNFPDQQFSA